MKISNYEKEQAFKKLTRKTNDLEDRIFELEESLYKIRGELLSGKPYTEILISIHFLSRHALYGD